MLVAFGFSMSWVNWIMNLISSAFFSILVNGVPSGITTPTRGIRQGDPLSPFLFILMADGLGRSISAAKDVNSIKGLCGTPDGASHSHQQFVDDTMLMGYPSVQEASRFRKCLDQFCNASGLEVNAQKSQVFSLIILVLLSEILFVSLVSLKVFFWLLFWALLLILNQGRVPGLN